MTARFNLLLAGALVFAILLSLMAGKVWIPLHDWASGDLASLIILELRLPRTLLGGAIGAALGIAEIGRAHVSTPVTNAHLVCRLLLEKKKNISSKQRVISA